jgi:FkbM family methyltransferase
MAIRRTWTKIGRALLPEALKRPLRRRIQQGAPMPMDLDFGLIEDNGSFHAHLPGGARIVIPPAILSEFRSNFENDWDEMKSFLEIADSSNVLFDVGADKGVMAASFAALDPNKKALAYEPSHSGCALMHDLLALNGLSERVEIVSKIVGETSGQVAFSQEDCGYVQVVPVASAEEVEAECVTLDQERIRLGFAPDLLKIDVEGYEGEVLRGAEKMLTEDGPVICLEVHLAYLEKRGIDPADILRSLEQKGYLVFSLQGKRVSPEKAVTSVRQIVRVVCRKD